MDVSRVSRFMDRRFVTLGLNTLKSVHKPAKVGRFVTLDPNTVIKNLATTLKVSVDLPELAGLWTVYKPVIFQGRTPA